MEPLSVLLVDDDEVVCDVMGKLLKSMNYETYLAYDKATAIELAKKHYIDLAFLDFQLNDSTGLELMTELKEIHPGLVSIIITGYASIDRAVEAMQAGAWDFITKPLTLSILKEKFDRIKEYSLLRREHDFRKRVGSGDFVFPGIVGASDVMHPIYETILRAAQSNLPTLIEGDTGTGKEYIAQAVHLNSRRKDKPFVVMDCTATPESLIESVLFGAAKGAFTGAVERKGLLEEADGGTLFMDEVGEIDLEIQPKLLRCLETKRFRPVGKTKEVESDFRIICATNRDLQEEVKKGNFRSDLYYRIPAQRIRIPLLSQRPSDIPILAKTFLQNILEENPGEQVEFSPSALRKLTGYSWPGNIRQLKFVVEYSFFNRTGNRIEAEHILLDEQRMEEKEDPSTSPMPDTDTDFKEFREKAILEAEKHYVSSLLERTGGDVREAAEIAGMTREALYRVMARCGVSPKEFRE